MPQKPDPSDRPVPNAWVNARLGLPPRKPVDTGKAQLLARSILKISVIVMNLVVLVVIGSALLGVWMSSADVLSQVRTPAH